MSWSVSMIGKPEAICDELEKESVKLSGQSKLEFDEAKPMLVGLLRQNFAEQAENAPTIHLEASGSGYSNGVKQIQRQCSVSIKPSYTKLV